MKIQRHVVAAAVLSTSLLAVSAFAQDPTPPAPSPAPPNLAYVEGTVDVVQDGVTERAHPPSMVLPGDIIRTRNGRAEVVFGDGTLLHMAGDTELELLEDEHLRLLNGRIIVRVSHRAGRAYVIDTPASPVHLETQGEYSVSTTRAARLDVAVSRGSATIQQPTPWTIRGAQMYSVAAAGARPLIQSFNSAAWDTFGLWSYDRANGFAASASSAQLPYELRPYAPVLDTYGRWDYLAPHGYVWYPSVAADWRPYYDGSWRVTRYGWTWHGHDRWAWPTHHYGRWGFHAGFWYWIPSTAWAPAWVSWSVTSGFVSWAPLGWDNRPVFRLWGRPDHPAYWPDYAPGRGWTILRRDHFAPRRHVRQHAIGIERLDDDTRRALAEAVPIIPSRDVAVPRDAFPGANGNVRRPTSGARDRDPAGSGRPQRSYSSYGAYAPGPTGPADAPHNPPGAMTRRPADAPPQPNGTTADERPTRSRRPVDQPASGPPGRPADSPAYAAPRSWSSGDERRGGVRNPGARSAPENTPRETPRANPRGEQPSGPPPSSGSAPPPSAQGGAVERGGSARAPRAGAPAGQGSPPTSGSPPSGSRPGNVRRPGS